MELNQFKAEVLPIRIKVYDYSVSMLDDLDEAEDTVQEVFLKLWMMRYKLVEYQSVEALAIQITKNICLNKIAYQKRHRKEALSQVQDFSVENTEKRIETSDMVEMVKQIIETLPPLQKMIIKMRDVDDCALDDIAEIIGCTVEAARMNLSRARRKVKEMFFKINNIGTI